MCIQDYDELCSVLNTDTHTHTHIYIYWWDKTTKKQTNKQ